jgi:uncharacterized protein YecT (DUF1311 family)
MASCIFDLPVSERLLAQTLLKLRSSLTKQQHPLLDESHRAWLTYRKAECAWRAGGNPANTISTSDVIACTANMNRSRARELRLEFEAGR